MPQTESKMFIYSCTYAIVTSLVTPWLFTAFKGEYPVFLSYIICFLISHANVSNKPFTIFLAFIRRYTEMDLLQEMFDFSSNIAGTINM